MRAARRLVAAALLAGDKIELRNMRRGKYFRIVADVFIDGIDLAQLLITAGLARSYDGGTKSEWCK